MSYTYNPDGTRHTMTDATGTTTYSYDANGDVPLKALVAAQGSGWPTPPPRTATYTTGVLASVTYPAYGTYPAPTVTYTYDATGAMASETDWLGNKVTFAHDADGNPTDQDNDVYTANPAGTSSTAFSYDNADQNTQAASTLAQTCGGSETLTQAFSGPGGSRNPDGQLTQIPSHLQRLVLRARPPTSATTATTRPAGSSTRAPPPKAPAPTTSPTTPPAIPPPSPATTSPATSTPTPRPTTPPARSPPRHPTSGSARDSLHLQLRHPRRPNPGRHRRRQPPPTATTRPAR